MQVAEYADTSTPSGTTQSLLRNGVRRKLANPVSQVGTALIFGAVTVGGQLESYGMVLDNYRYQFESRIPDQNFQTVALMESLGQIDTDDRVPLELQRLLLSADELKMAISSISSADDDQSFRLIPPATREYRVRVRLRKLGEEMPRVWHDPDLD